MLSCTLLFLLLPGPGSNQVPLLVRGELVKEMIFERPVDIKLPDGIPHIVDMRDFIQALKTRSDYNEAPDRWEESEVSRSEAASMAFELARIREVAQPVMCDKYYSLFETDRYQTVGGVEELLEEARLLDLVEQPDANLAAHLTAESRFNALKRLTLLHHVLEEEGIGVKSSLDLKVQKSLLECIDYYAKRHRRALNGLSDYIWNKRDQIPSYKGNLDKIMEQFHFYIDKIRQLELEIAEAQDDDELITKLKNDLLNRIVKMHRVLKLAAPMIPISVLSFITDVRRKNHFERVSSIMDQYDKLKRHVLELENKPGRLADYKDALMSLHDFAKPHEQWAQDEFHFIMQAPRDALIIGHLYRREHQGEELPTLRQLTTPLEVVLNRKLEQRRQIEGESQLAQQQQIDFPELDSDRPISTTPDTRAGGWGLMPYSLVESEEFVEPRSLEEYDITFYVRPNFDETYEEREMIRIMGDVVKQTLAKLNAQCIQEKAARLPRVSCQKYQEIYGLIHN